ncbi:ABC transporter ATP-binding protein [Alcaligenaceae bacterium]|nr:ABC transporter ATP-binding protein [Alcaligenaceae bacterium]
MTDIVLTDVTKTYGATTVLDKLSLTIKEGEFLTLLGASGCGKSTLLKLLAGLELPDTGEIRKGGVNLLSQTPSERDCAMVFQSYALYPHMTVGDNICTPLYMSTMSFTQRLPGARWFSPSVRSHVRAAHAHGRKVAEILGIEHLWSRKPAALSGGQRQRVALARAMVRRPSLFLFDEPLSNLDANLRQSLRAEIRQLHDELGVTFVYVTHDQHEAMSMSDRIAVMKGGRILQLDTPTSIYSEPQHRDVAAFVGAPRINFLPVVRNGNNKPTIQGQLLEQLLPAGVAEVGFRPHAVSLRRLPDALKVNGRILQVEYTGTEHIVTMVTPEDDKITLVIDDGLGLRVGEDLSIFVPMEQCHAFDAGGFRLVPLCTAFSCAA